MSVCCEAQMADTLSIAKLAVQGGSPRDSREETDRRNTNISQILSPLAGCVSTPQAALGPCTRCALRVQVIPGGEQPSFAVTVRVPAPIDTIA